MALAEYLGVPFVVLCNNGSIALNLAYQALDLSGEVITTPYSFVATSSTLVTENIKPVFVDIDPVTLNIDPDKIEAAITPQTTAILAVHVYGRPCDTKKIAEVAEKHNLKVVYDAAHAFGVKKNGISILNAGDLSTLSFHATKVFSTIEGGAIICHSQEMKTTLDNLKNFGIINEVEVVDIGTNAKLNEVQAAFGLLSLKTIDQNLQKRKGVSDLYQTLLVDVPGITIQPTLFDTEWNYAYYPILIDKTKYGMSRDDLYEKLKKVHVFSRRYFYPLISDFKPYQKYRKAKTSVAARAANEVLCLPIYPDLSHENVELIAGYIKEWAK